MDDSITVQIFDGNSNLVGNLFNSLLGEFEVTNLDVIEQIFTLHVLEDNVIIVGVFKKINQTDNVGVLTHFKHVYFSSLLIYFNWFHIFFVHSLNRHLLSSFLVRSQFDESKLSFSQVLFKIVKIKQVGVANNLFKMLNPSVLHVGVFKI